MRCFVSSEKRVALWESVPSASKGCPQMVVLAQIPPRPLLALFFYTVVR